MSINNVVLNIFNEQLGAHGVEMHNDRFPAMQDDGGNQDAIKVRKEGDPNLATGTDNSSFHKKDSEAPWTRNQKPNLTLGRGYNFSKESSLLRGLGGEKVVKFFGRES